MLGAMSPSTSADVRRLGGDGAGAEGVDPDPAGAVLARELPGETHYTVLGGRVGGSPCLCL